MLSPGHIDSSLLSVAASLLFPSTVLLPMPRSCLDNRFVTYCPAARHFYLQRASTATAGHISRTLSIRVKVIIIVRVCRSGWLRRACSTMEQI